MSKFTCLKCDRELPVKMIVGSGIWVCKECYAFNRDGAPAWESLPEPVRVTGTVVDGAYTIRAMVEGAVGRSLGYGIISVIEVLLQGKEYEPVDEEEENDLADMVRDALRRARGCGVWTPDPVVAT